MDWRERDHPRHPDGRFRDKAGPSEGIADWSRVVSERLGAASGYVDGGSRFERQEKLEETLTEGREVGERERMTGGISAQVRIATFEMPDGSTRRYLHKQYPAYEGEDELSNRRSASETVAGWIGLAIGAPVPPIAMDPDEPGGLFMELIPGQAPYRPAMSDEANSTDGRLIGLLDLLIGNQDRHGGNWLVLDDGSIAGIDQGFTLFSYDTDREWTIEAVERRDRRPWNDFTEHYLNRVPGGGDLTENDWHPDDLDEIRRRLVVLFRTERFQDIAPRAGESWAPGVDESLVLARLDSIRAKATGTVRRLT